MDDLANKLDQADKIKKMLKSDRCEEHSKLHLKASVIINQERQLPHYMIVKHKFLVRQLEKFGITHRSPLSC